MAVPSRQRRKQAAVDTAATTAGSGVLLGRAISPPMCATEMNTAAGGSGQQQHVNDNAATATAIAQVLLICCAPSGWATRVAQL